MPDKISKQVAFLEKNKADFVFCGMYRIVNGYKFYEPLIDFENDKDSIEQLLVRNRASTQTMLMKKTITEKVSFDITFNRFQDWDFTLQVALNNYRLMYLKEPLAESMIRNDSISSNVNTNEALTHLYEKYKSYYKKYPHALAEYYISQARAYKNIDQKEAQRFLVKSFATKKNAKTLGRLLLNFVGLWDELGRNKLTYKKNGIGRNNKENRKNLNNVIIENTDSIDRGVILDKIYRQMKCFASEGRRIYA